MSGRWVCLMYHDVLAEVRQGSASAVYFSVDRPTFAAHLDRLANEGHQGRSIAAVLNNSAEHQVAVSFDDGDTGQYQQAFPELVRRRMTATFFITTDWVGRAGYISWDGLREMKAAGMSIQSHTCSHPFLSELGPESVQNELRASREILSEKLSQVTDMLALPGGDFPRGGAVVFQEAGYRVVATSRWGANATGVGSSSGVTFVRRCTVRRASTEQEFRAIISGDRWLSTRRRMRGLVLHTIRQALSPSRYHRWRRTLLGLR